MCCLAQYWGVGDKYNIDLLVFYIILQLGIYQSACWCVNLINIVFLALAVLLICVCVDVACFFAVVE